VPDFGRANGMCSFRDWFHYQNITRDATPGDDLLLRVRDRLMHRTDAHAPQTLKEARTLKTHAHACDRSYQHTEFGICQDAAARPIRVSHSYATPATAQPVSHSTDVRTWAVDGDASKIRVCDMGRDRSRSNPVNGFLNPYEYEDALTQACSDTLRHVPQTVGRCVDFGVCHTPVFLVQGLAARRLVVMVERSDGATWPTSRHCVYSHSDTEACFAAGQLVAEHQRRGRHRALVPRGPAVQLLRGAHALCLGLLALLRGPDWLQVVPPRAVSACHALRAQRGCQGHALR